MDTYVIFSIFDYTKIYIMSTYKKVPTINSKVHNTSKRIICDREFFLPMGREAKKELDKAIKAEYERKNNK